MNQNIPTNDGKVEATTVNIKDGGAGMVKAETVSIKDGGAAVIIGQTIKIKDGGGAVMVADHAEFTEGGVGLLIARQVSGEARILIDIKAAVVFGLIVGLAIGLLRLLAGRR